LCWSRAEKETGTIRDAVVGTDSSERVLFFCHHRTGPRDEWEDVQESVLLSWTACNFGGERPWFICAGAECDQRVAILYGPRPYFLCRHCYDLSYHSQREDKMHWAFRRAQKIRERLGGSANMAKPFPERPKGMHMRLTGGSERNTTRRSWSSSPA
jgi:hypothetical protein